MFLYTALGDSITAGEGARSPALAYPSLIVSALRRRRIQAVGEVLAEPGWTSHALLDAMAENPPVYLSKARAITIWIGGDDVAYTGLALLEGAPRSVVPRAIRRYGVDAVTIVRYIRKVSKANIILCTQYNPFPNSPLAVEAIQTLNAVTAQISAQMHTALARANAWFAGREAALIAGYHTGRLQDVFRSSTLPVHPNDAGHRVIAEGLLPFIVSS